MRSIVLSIWSMLIGLALFQTPARADDNWMFKRSYYSHHNAKQVTIGRQTAPGPVYTSPQGAYVRTGVRYLNSRISIPRGGVDSIQMWESWVQTGEQY